MQTIAYGLFTDEVAADAALDGLRRQGYLHEVLKLAEHVGEIKDQDVLGMATRSRSYALLGGAVAAVSGAVLGPLVFAELLGVNPVATGIIAALAGGVLGALLGSLAGSSVPRPEVEALGREVAAGKVLVGLVVENKRVGAELRGKLAEFGAVRAGLLSGTGIKAVLGAR